MNKTNTDLNKRFKQNEIIWKSWLKNGFDISSENTIDFDFYSTRKLNMELFCSVLKVKKIEYEIMKKRTFLFLKGWVIRANVSKKWTLEILQNETKIFHELAEDCSILYEGCGTFIKDK